MSARITSITDLRAEARRRDQLDLARSRVVVFILVLVGLLLVVGLGATMSASSAQGIFQDTDRLATFKGQLRWVVVGIAAMIVAIRIPYALYKRAAVFILGSSLVSLVLVLWLGIERGGSRRWLEVGSVTVQPSEFAKLAVVIFLAAVLADGSDRLSSLSKVLGPTVMSVGLACALVLVEPDLGTSVIIAAAGGGVIIASGVPMRYIAGGGATVLLLASGAAWLSDYRRERLACFFDPFEAAGDECYQVTQSLIALGSGGITGVGLGASRARWAFLPHPHTDFIFAIIAEETGFIGATSLLVGLAGLSLAGIWIAYRTGDLFARLLASGITTWLGVQAIVNVGAVVGAIPVTGVVLPFVSVGGTAMVVAMIGVGILINIARTAPHPSQVQEGGR